MDKDNVFELDAEALKTIVEQVSKELAPSIKEELEKSIADVSKNLKEEMSKDIVAKTEAIKKKNVGAEGEAKEESKIAKMTPHQRIANASIALVNGDNATLKDYNAFAIEERQKAGYANTDVNADGGYIVVDPLFEAEIESLAEVYGVALTDTTVRQITQNSVKTNKRGSNVQMFETGQGVAKTGTKLVIEQVTVDLRKFAAIAVSTDELVDDAAIDFWADVAEGFAEERARILDEMVFTDTNVTTPGILFTSGVQIVSVGATISLLNWDHLLDAEVSVPTRSMQNGKHYMHRTIWNIVRKSKDDNNKYQLVPEAGIMTPWGTPVRLVDVLPSSSVVGDANEGYAVFGDLKRAKLYMKKGLVLATSQDATVADADGNDVNLFEQDMTALRAVMRAVLLVKFPEAFCVIGTGTVS